MGLEAQIVIARAAAGCCPQRGAITQGFRASLLSKPIPLVLFKTRVKKMKREANPQSIWKRRCFAGERPQNVGLP